MLTLLLFSTIVSSCISFMLYSLNEIIFDILDSFYFGTVESQLSVSDLIDDTRDLFLVTIDIVVTFFLDLQFLLTKFVCFKL